PTLRSIPSGRCLSSRLDRRRLDQTTERTFVLLHQSSAGNLQQVLIQLRIMRRSEVSGTSTGVRACTVRELSDNSNSPSCIRNSYTRSVASITASNLSRAPIISSHRRTEPEINAWSIVYRLQQIPMSVSTGRHVNPPPR